MRKKDSKEGPFWGNFLRGAGESVMSQVVSNRFIKQPGALRIIRLAKVSLLLGALLLGGILPSVGEAAPMPRNQTKALRCQKLELRVGQCAKAKRPSRRIKKNCHTAKRKFKSQCYFGSVCGQPPMTKCPDGFVCPTVMPAVKSYDSMAQLKSDGAYFLYYGVCLN
jgi:hypothetical protein